jgi:hypothetical protein
MDRQTQRNVIITSLTRHSRSKNFMREKRRISQVRHWSSLPKVFGYTDKEGSAVAR